MTKYGLTTSSLCSAPKSRLLKCKKPVIWVLLISLLVGALSMYLLQVNAIAAKGFEIRNLESQVNDLNDENEKLSVQVVELKAMNELDDKVAALNMVPIDSMVYYDTTGQVVARR